MLPASNAAEAACIEGLDVLPVAHLSEAIDHLRGRRRIEPLRARPYAELLGEKKILCDFADVRGQKGAKRALEIAAAGGHNVLMIGPPGSGKTMMARCLPGILPDMTLEEALEVTRIHSAAGTLAADPAYAELDLRTTGFGSAVMAIRPGDGSAREQAASCQRVLGGVANLCEEYATKRYRSNVINWGMLPFTLENIAQYNIRPGDRLYVPGVRAALAGEAEELAAQLLQGDRRTPVTLRLGKLTREERDTILAGCLMTYYAGKN